MVPNFSLIKAARTRHSSRLGRRLFVFPLLWLVMSVFSTAQSSSATPDQATLQALMQRIDQLAARVRQLEAAQHQPASVSASSEPGHAPQQPPAAPVTAEASKPQSSPATSLSESTQANPAQEHETEPAEHTENERMDLSKTLLRIRGFGDVTFHGDNYHPPATMGPPDYTSFTLGQLNLFVTSDISDKFKFLSEIVFEAGPDNIYGNTRGEANSFGVDVERYLLTYSYNDYFNLSAGRYHTAIGYCNTAYHHSTWLQTTTQLFDTLE